MANSVKDMAIWKDCTIGEYGSGIGRFWHLESGSLLRYPALFPVVEYNLHR